MNLGIARMQAWLGNGGSQPNTHEKPIESLTPDQRELLAIRARVAELEAALDSLTNPATSECGSFIHHRFPVTHAEAIAVLNRK